MTRALVIGALLWASGCYSPGVDACLYRCSTTGGCPNNLSCNEQNWCAASATDRCDDTPITDAADAPGSCPWSVANIDACARGLDTIVDNWTIPSGTVVVIDATTGSATGFPAGAFRGAVDQVDAAHTPAFLVAVHDLTIDGEITVLSDRPVIFAANGKVSIAGTLRVETNAAPNLSCPASTGLPTQSGNGAGGGAGGSFGSVGGGGGTGGGQAGSGAALSAGGSPGLVATDQTLIPLRRGCPGGRGGSAGGTAGGLGGEPGGGLQISARQSLEVTGRIQANGTGGGGSFVVQVGAGGGGSGGSILLQAPTVTISNGLVCANGGGGGGSFSSNATGFSSDCGPTPAAGASTGTAEDNGGDGATGAIGAKGGASGLSVTAGTPAHGGGGGGGGVGVIRILGTYANTGTSIVSPAPKF